MSEEDELTPAADRSARVVSRLPPVAAVLAAIAFLIVSTASVERVKANESVNQRVERVLRTNRSDPVHARPRLVHRFTCSPLNQFEPRQP